jgi:hypothetical protein
VNELKTSAQQQLDIQIDLHFADSVRVKSHYDTHQCNNKATACDTYYVHSMCFSISSRHTLYEADRQSHTVCNIMKAPSHEKQQYSTPAGLWP